MSKAYDPKRSDRRGDYAFWVFFLFWFPALVLYQMLGWFAAMVVLFFGIGVAIWSAQKTK
jgi:hypothetical protein